MRSILVVLVAAISLAVPLQAQTASPEQQAVLKVVTAYHEALAQGDSLAALKLLADDVTILESGSMETRADYRGHHLPADIAFARAVPSVRGESTVTVIGDVAWVVSTSKTTGSYRERPVNSVGAELVVLSRGPSGWQIRAIHWSSRAIRTP